MIFIYKLKISILCHESLQDKSSLDAADSLHPPFSSPDVGRAYVYDPTTLTLVRQTHSTSSNDYEEQSTPPKPKKHAEYDELQPPKPRRTKTLRKPRPCSSRSPRCNSAEILGNASRRNSAVIGSSREHSPRANNGIVTHKGPGELMRAITPSLIPLPTPDNALQEVRN